ncbi:hypothetical protein ACFV3F_06205 [Streptomyces sp. NPDC059717]|uniref:hypothetical protein n=1 Tax=Streptomyces sp. NPDC059717 TaxID=3346922 RepID=UPI00368CD42C
MFRRTDRAAWLRWTTVAATVGAVTSAGMSATAADEHTPVDCRGNPSALQPAIAAAAQGATLSVRGRCIGPFTIGKSLTLVGRGQAVLDGNRAGTAVTISGAVNVRLNRLTVTGGQGSKGGGILNAGGALTMDHSTVTRNTSSSTGGGIRNEGTLTVQFSSVHDNTARTLGGGLDNVGPGGRLLVIRSTVHHNTSDQVDGGGIFNDGTATVDFSVVSGNRAPVGSGGGIRDTGVSGRLTLNGTVVRDNTAAGVGGGVSVGAPAVATLNHSQVRNNFAGTAGGGINVDGGALTVKRTRVVGNTPNNCAPTGAVPGCIG